MLSPLRHLLLLSLAAALGSGCSAWGSRNAPRLFVLEDPKGDDHGDGELLYPLRQDLQQGDLDLLSLEAFEVADGTRFEATFARPITVPSSRSVDVAGQTQRDIARHGFYTFNLDIYVDTDGAPGSGRAFTLPGRNLTLAPSSSWEKAIILTPRPFEAHDAMRKQWHQAAVAEHLRTKGGLGSAAEKQLKKQTAEDFEAHVFFPSQVRVTGNRVQFFVPREFLGGSARPEWGYAVAVTGASLNRQLNLAGLFGAEDSPTTQGLMVLGIGPNISNQRFGGGRKGDPLQSPVVDLLVPPGVDQWQVLGPNAPPWPAVVPAGRPPEQAPAAAEAPPAEALPQPPDAAGASGQAGPPGAGAP